MKKVKNVTTVKCIFLCLVIVLSTVNADEDVSKVDSYVEGRHYELIDNAASLTHDPIGLVKVEKFFQYGCKACYGMTKVKHEWENGSSVKVIDIPAPFGGSATFQAKAFYVQMLLEADAEVHQGIYETIHEKRERFHDYENMKEYFVSEGFDEDRVKDVFFSDELSKNMKFSSDSLRRYQILKLPTMVVNGKYKVTYNSHVKSEAQFTKVVNYLVSLEQDE